MRSVFRSILLIAAFSLLSTSVPAENSIGGFVQTWLAANEGTDRTVDDFGLLVKHARVKFTGTPTEGVKLVVMPELAGGLQAGGLQLLDAYGDWTIDEEGVYTLRFGQFKFPFGLNRMYHPGALNRSGYSSINGLFPGHAWDVGGALLYRRGLFSLDAAIIEGQGPNLLASNGVGTRRRSDASGKLEVALMDKAVVVGASIYQGLRHANPFATAMAESHTWSGGHVKASFGSMAMEAEVISRDDLNWGATIEPRYAINDQFTLLVYYDRRENQASDLAGSTAVGGGIIYSPNKKVEITLDVIGKSTGPEQKPVNTAAVLQTQFNF